MSPPLASGPVVWYPLAMKNWAIPIGLLVSILTFQAFGLPNREVTEFAIFRVDRGRVISQRFEYDKLKPNTKFHAKSPHGMLNPEGKIEEWSGNSIRSLLQEIDIAPSDMKTEVTVIGTDGYLAQMELRDFFNPDAMLATHASGKKISPSKGGPQLVYPNQDPTLRNELKFEGWGVWYVAAIIVGDLPPEVSITSPSGTSKVAKLSFKAPSSRTTPKYYPPGHFRTAFDTKPIKVGVYNLKSWIGDHEKTKFSKAVAHTYYGGKVQLGQDLSQYDLVVSWDGALIPSKFGGPAQICPRGKVSQCTFQLREIVLEN